MSNRHFRHGRNLIKKAMAITTRATKAIAATIVVCVLLGSLSSTWSIALAASIGGMIVFLGLWMEKEGDKEEFIDVDDFRVSKLRKKIGWWILMFGILIEIGVAGLTAKNDWEARQDRTITNKQRNSFILWTKNYPKVPVRVFVGLEDYETLHYAQKIRQMLDAAGYGFKIDGGRNEGVNVYEGVVEEGILHVDVNTIDDPHISSSFGVFSFQYGTNRTAILKFVPGSAEEIKTNSFARFTVLNLALVKIGLSPGCAEDNRFLKPGEFGILVPQKNH